MSAVATGRTTTRRPAKAAAPVAASAPAAPSTGRKTKVGRVVSDKMDKTIVVSVERLSRHPVYKRVIRLTTKFKAHDEANEARLGDTVLIQESRPLSATKRWRLVRVVARAGETGGVDLLAGEEEATFEAIHMAAHPGREHVADESATEAPADAQAADAEAADAEAADAAEADA
jgi:small subunit ribosomal protein S17